MAEVYVTEYRDAFSQHSWLIKQTKQRSASSLEEIEEFAFALHNVDPKLNVYSEEKMGWLGVTTKTTRLLGRRTYLIEAAYWLWEAELLERGHFSEIVQKIASEQIIEAKRNLYESDRYPFYIDKAGYYIERIEDNEEGNIILLTGRLLESEVNRYPELDYVDEIEEHNVYGYILGEHESRLFLFSVALWNSDLVDLAVVKDAIAYVLN